MLCQRNGQFQLCHHSVQPAVLRRTPLLVCTRLAIHALGVRIGFSESFRRFMRRNGAIVEDAVRSEVLVVNLSKEHSGDAPTFCTSREGVHLSFTCHRFKQRLHTKVTALRSERRDMDNVTDRRIFGTKVATTKNKGHCVHTTKLLRYAQ
jgi:hypothetical protein